MAALLERLKEIQERRLRGQTTPAFQRIWNVPLLATPEKPRDGYLFPQVRRLGLIEALTKKPLLTRLFEVIGR